MSYIQNNDPYKEKTSTEFLEFFSDKEVNNTQNSKKDMDAYSAFKNSVSIPLETDLTQTRHKLDTNLTQTRHKLDTDLTQTRHELDTNPDTDLTQTRHKNDDIPDLHNLSVMGMKIMQYIFDICVNSGNRITPRLRHKNIAESLNLNSKSLPTTISRMVKDGFILRRIDKKQDCRGSQYIINDFIYAKMMNLTHTRHKLNTNPDTNPDTKSSSSSRIYLNKNNITSTNNMEFENFFKNVTELNPSILLNSQNVRKNEILNIYNARSSITPEEFVNSLEDFCYDIENGILKNITIPRSLFVKIMKMENYESEVRVKKQIEALKQQKIRKDKQNKELLEAQIALFPDEYDKALKSWINSLSDNDYKDLFGIEKDSPYFLNKDRVIEAKFQEIEWTNIFKELNS